MENKIPKRNLAFVILINAGICLLAFFILIKSIDTEETWRIVCASLGFAIFSTFTFLLLRKYRVQYK